LGGELGLGGGLRFGHGPWARGRAVGRGWAAGPGPGPGPGPGVGQSGVRWPASEMVDAVGQWGCHEAGSVVVWPVGTCEKHLNLVRVPM